MKVTRFFKITVLLNCLVPATLLGYDAIRGHLGANPVNFAIRTTGLLALIFLMLTLAITPAMRIGHWSWLGQFRRMLGLCAFFHGSLHFLLFYGLDRGGKVGDTLLEIIERPYLMVGTLAVVGMVPLAATSTDGMIRRMGGRRWKALHRLTYAIAILGVVHFYMLVKADITRPVAFAAVLAVLLGYRLFAYSWELRTGYQRLKAASMAASPVALPASRPTSWAGPLKVARIFRETPEVRTFRLVSPDSWRLPFDFLPGQYLNVSLMVDGKKVNRSYTIASPPTRVGYCEVTVKREELGVSSKHLHDVIREGGTIQVSAPAGRFTFTGVEAESLLLLAGGVGITPMMAKIRYLTDIGWPGEIHLVFAVKAERDIIFRDEIDYLRGRFPNFRATVTLTGDDGSTWPGERGRISADLLKRTVPDLPSRRAHICGPVAMMDAMVEILKGSGTPPDRIHLESFVRAAPASVDEPVVELLPTNGVYGPASVTFSRSGRSKPIGRDQTVLEASEELGVDIPYDCRAGICGQCKVRLVSGSVVMDTQDALGPSDRANHMILSCQARCLDPVVVEA